MKIHCLPKYGRLLLLMLTACAGCGGNKSLTAVSADYEKNITRGIQKHIDDDDRKDKLLNLEQEIRHLNDQIEQLYFEAGKKIRNTPNISEEDTARVMDTCAEERKTKLNEIGKIRLEMRALTSRAEWDAIFNRDVSK